MVSHTLPTGSIVALAWVSDIVHLLILDEDADIFVACANGEVAPFVGHNAFLRWKALQDAAFLESDENIIYASEDAPKKSKKVMVEKIWSESNVSEDFDMALRLLRRGFIVRWATYSNGDFKEGVSLTVDDELNRWQKYAYGTF